LLQGKWEAAGIIAISASRGVDIICASTSLNGKVFNVAFQKLDNERILEMWKQRRKGANKSSAQTNHDAEQNVVDYAMNTIALPLPPEKRGYYQNSMSTLGVV
jgi:uncharacterized protein YsxB (DUF464 family)